MDRMLPLAGEAGQQRVNPLLTQVKGIPCRFVKGQAVVFPSEMLLPEISTGMHAPLTPLPLPAGYPHIHAGYTDPDRAC